MEMLNFKKLNHYRMRFKNWKYHVIPQASMNFACQIQLMVFQAAG